MKNYDFNFNLRNSYLDLDKHPRTFNSDRNNFKISLSILDGTKNNLRVVTDLTNYAAKLCVVKPRSKEYVELDGVAIEGKFEFYLDERFNNQLGEYECEFQIQEISEDRIMTSKSFCYKVDSSILTDLSEELKDNPDVFILKSLIEDVQRFENTYSTKEELQEVSDKKANANHEHNQYLTEHQDLSDYATKESVDEKLNNKADKSHEHSQYLTSHQDLSDYATKEELQEKANINHTHSEYLTQHQDISHLVTQQQFTEHKETNVEYVNLKDIDVTARDEVILLKDSSDREIKEMRIFGKSEQKNYKGMNLLNVTSITNDYGLNIQLEEGIITVSGTTSENVAIKLGLGEEMTLNGTYYYKDFSSNNINRIIFYNNISTGFEYVGDMYGNNPLEKQHTFNTVGFSIATGTYNNYKIMPVISTVRATEYEPYTGGLPSPSPSYPQEIVDVVEPTVKVLGKNLLNLPNANFTRGGLDVECLNGKCTIKGTAINNHILYIVNGWGSQNVLFTLPKGTYTVTDNITLESWATGERIRKSNTFTLTEPFKVTAISITRVYLTGDVSDEIYYPQVEVGTVATEYEEYKEQIIQAHYVLRGIGDVKDELIIRADGSGKLIQRVYSEIFNDYTNKTPNTIGYRYGYKLKEKAFTGTKNIKSNKFKHMNTDWNAANNITTSNVGDFVFVSCSTDSLTDVEVIYELETPIETELSKEQVQAILGNAQTYKPNTTIYNDKGVEVEVTYVADTKAYIDNKFAELTALVLENGGNV